MSYSVTSKDLMLSLSRYELMDRNFALQQVEHEDNAGEKIHAE